MSGFKTEALSAPLETSVTPADPSGSSSAIRNRSSAHAFTQWVDLVERIKTEDQSGMEELYRVFSRGVRFYLCRQLGPQDLEDKVHDTFLIVVQAVRRGELRGGDNDHHRAEATFKALARALDDATRSDPRLGDAVPSTKGVI